MQGRNCVDSLVCETSSAGYGFVHKTILISDFCRDRPDYLMGMVLNCRLKQPL